MNDLTHPAVQLVLHADNDRMLALNTKREIRAELARQMAAGTYSKEAACKAFGRLATAAAESYEPSDARFSEAVLQEAATHWAAEFQVHWDNPNDLEPEVLKVKEAASM